MHRSIMALGIFVLLTSDGDHAQADHMFTSKAGDMVAMVDMLDAAHCENHRLHAVPALVSRLRNGIIYPTSCVRLVKAECHVPVNAIADFGQSMLKITKTRKLADLLASSACVY